MSKPKADWGYGAASEGAMRAYEQSLVGAIFEPWARALLEELGVRPGEVLLDVATGPGTVARLASSRLGGHGRVTACDLSPGMLAVAREKPAIPGGASIDYLECPAASLAAPSATYDVVTCQQGVQFFPDRPAALAEMGRVLKPGGRLGVAVWCEIDRCPPFAALAEAIGAVMGDQVAARFKAGPWGLSNADQISSLIAGAGFEQVEVTERRQPVTFDRGPAQLVASLPASGIAAEFEALHGSERKALEIKAAELMSPLVVDGRVQSDLTSTIGTAVKPH